MDVARGKVKSRRSSGFRLTERDVSILSFLLDQKFASLEQIYFMFFDVRASVDDPLPRGLFVTRQRLQILRKAGLVITQKVYTESKSVYLLTPLGFKIIESRRPNDAYAQPVKRVDFRNYEHDTRVNDCRIALERSGRVMKWFSDRRLKMDGFSSQFSSQNLPKSVVPDGVFVSKKGKRVIFEIEASTRKKKRYQDKYWDFRSVMGGSDSLIHHVIWVGATPVIKRALKSIVNENKEFSVESYLYFLNKYWPDGVKKRS